MNDIPPPAQEFPDSAAQDPNAPQPAAGSWAAGVFSGPAGWPGSIHANFTAQNAEAPGASVESANASTESTRASSNSPSTGASVQSVRQPETPPLQPVVTSAPQAAPVPVLAPQVAPVAAPASRIEVVEARPITLAEKRGPTIDAAPAVRVDALRPAPTAAQAPLFPEQPVYTGAAAANPTAPLSASSESAPNPIGATLGATAAQSSTEQAAWSSTAPNNADNGGAIPPATNAATAPRRFERPQSPFWTVILHLAYLVPLPPHIAGLVITALIWVWRRGRDPHIEQQGRESLNFQLTYLAANAVLAATCLGSVLTPVVWIIGAVLCIVAAARAADGERYRYPFIFRLIA